VTEVSFRVEWGDGESAVEATTYAEAEAKFMAWYRGRIGKPDAMPFIHSIRQVKIPVIR
jgi:hypothetical protein